MSTSTAWSTLARVLIGEPEYTSLEVATATGVPIEEARRLWGALGFAPVPEDERIFTRSDVAMLGGVRTLLEQKVADPAVVLQLTRVVGQALARVAEAQVAATASGGLSGKALLERTSTLAQGVEPFLAYAWHRHLLAALLRVSAERDQASGAPTLAVGFVDLVGFTALSQQLSEGELAETVERFEALAYEHIPERGGRVIKMIGDEVMFAADQGRVAADIALALVEAYTRDPALPEVRVGLAVGPAVSWEGDLFGPTVNLASRLVNIARPGTVLVSDDLGTQLEATHLFALRHLRPIALKGIGRVRSWVLRRPTLQAP